MESKIRDVVLGRYLIELDPGIMVVGDKIQTRGNDHEWPTFRMLHDRSLRSMHCSKIKQRLEPGDELYQPS